MVDINVFLKFDRSRAILLLQIDVLSVDLKALADQVLNLLMQNDNKL